MQRDDQDEKEKMNTLKIFYLIGSRIRIRTSQTTYNTKAHKFSLTYCLQKYYPTSIDSQVVMAEAKESSSSKKGLVRAAVVLAATLLVVVATVATTVSVKGPFFKKGSAAGVKTYSVDLVGHDDEEIDPDHECVHSEIKGEVVQEMMRVLQEGGDVTTSFHLGGDDDGPSYSFSFTKEGLESTGADADLCFGTSDGGKFCLRRGANGDGSRQLQEGTNVPTAAPIFEFNFSIWFRIVFECLGCPGSGGYGPNDAP